MSSINPYYTLSYVQPDEYQFSHDSVFLARRVFELVQSENKNPKKVMDLCSGCGVIGIDYLVHLQNAGLPAPQKIDFLEVQSVYHPYFAKNISQIQKVNLFEFLTINYSQVSNYKELESQYDLILCNPPYFQKEMGVLSSSEFKNRCRFFIDSDVDHLFKAIRYLLSPNGCAYILLKDLSQNGISMQEQLKNYSDQLHFTFLEKIRTTDFYKIQLV